VPLVKVAILHDEIAYLEVDFLQLAVFVGVRHIPFAANHDHEVDAVGAVHSPARFSGRHVVARPEVELGHKGSKIQRLIARFRGKRHDVDSEGAFRTEKALLQVLAKHLLGSEGRVGSWSNPQILVGRPAIAVSGRSLACTTTPDLLSAVTILRIFILVSLFRVMQRYGARCIFVVNLGLLQDTAFNDAGLGKSAPETLTTAFHAASWLARS
jgi:hypothetical protein